VNFSLTASAKIQRLLPRLVLAPSLGLVLVCVYGFIAFTLYLSFTDSKILPVYDWAGLTNYARLFEARAWRIAMHNVAVFAALYIVVCICIGLLLAMLIDQKIRGEDVLRPVFLYPMALSFIVTGTAWKWLLDPGIGLEQTMIGLGWEEFRFGWIKDRDLAIYTIIIAAVWQSSGFVMALFLAGLRGIDDTLLHAARMDGASGLRLFYRIILPQLRAVCLAAVVVLLHMAIKSYDLIIAMTGGGPGRATEMPATFMYSYSFSRNEMGTGAAAAVIMLMTIAAIIVPYLYSESRAGRRD
jgi:glucose/mannose transport system permease protein